MCYLKWGNLYKRFESDAYGFCDDLDCDLLQILHPREIVLMSKNIPDVPRDERRGFHNAEMIALISDRASGESAYLVVEVRYTGGLRDTDLVRRNARFLTQITGARAIPAIASIRNTPEVQALIDSGAVQWHQMPEHFWPEGCP